MKGETCVRLELPESLDEAREICNKEGDGIFVYFQPRDPQAGATFAEPVQIGRAAA